MEWFFLDVNEDNSGEILKRIENIESILAEHLSFKSMFGDYDQIVRNYFRLVNLFLRHGKITPSVLLGTKMDPISESILEILFNLEKANVTQITDELRKEKGTASRTTVRKRLSEMSEKGWVSHTGDKDGSYRISEELVREWLKLVGMNINSGADIKSR